MHSREIVAKALTLHSRGWSNRHVASTCGVSEQAVSHWVNGTRRARTKDAERTTYCPQCGDGKLDPQAYSYLLGLYLGDGYIGAISKGVDYLTIICCDTWPGLTEECADSIGKVFPVSVFRVQREGCTEIKGTSKHWRCIFPQHGTGMKHTRKISLDPWQQQIVHGQPEKFIRGLMHSDGCRLTNRVRKKLRGEWKYYEYPRYQFVNVSTDIAGLLTEALDRLEIPRQSRTPLPERHSRLDLPQGGGGADGRVRGAEVLRSTDSSELGGCGGSGSLARCSRVTRLSGSGAGQLARRWSRRVRAARPMRASAAGWWRAGTVEAVRAATA